MNIFDMHRHILEAYRKYVQSFLLIADEQIREFVAQELLHQNTLWPEALLQLNPSYEMAATVEELVKQNKLHPLVPAFVLSSMPTSLASTASAKKNSATSLIPRTSTAPTSPAKPSAY